MWYVPKVELNGTTFCKLIRRIENYHLLNKLSDACLNLQGQEKVKISKAASSLCGPLWVNSMQPA